MTKEGSIPVNHWRRFLAKMEEEKRREIQYIDITTLISNESDEFEVDEDYLIEPIIRRPTVAYIREFIPLVRTILEEEQQAQPRRRELSEALDEIVEKSGHWDPDKIPKRAIIQARKFMHKLFDYSVKEFEKIRQEKPQDEEQQHRLDKILALVEVSGMASIPFTPLASLVFKRQGADYLWRTYFNTEKICSPFTSNIIPTIGWCERRRELHVFSARNPFTPEVLELQSVVDNQASG